MSAMSNGFCGNPAAARLLEFWFGDPGDPENVARRHKLWFQATPADDRTIQARFAGLHQRAARGDLDDWSATPHGLLALVVVLDQFSRNLYRATALAFANDGKSLALAQDAVRRGCDRPLQVVERAFLYMPFQHSEDVADQRRSVGLYQALVDDSPTELGTFARDTYRHAVLHCEIVERFGRFPHRNAPLGRTSTPQEADYLEQGGHRFGQG